MNNSNSNQETTELCRSRLRRRGKVPIKRFGALAVVACSFAPLFSRLAAAEEDERTVVLPDENVAVVFHDHVLPILRQNCLACHNRSETEGELILESPESILTGGDSGPAIVPGNADESLMFQVAAHRTEPIMPPPDNEVGASPLSSQDLGMLKAWIDQGAKFDPSAAVERIQWKRVPAAYAPVHALEVSPDGRWLVAGRGNELVLYSVVASREVQRLVDPSITPSHPNSAHLDIVQSVAWSPDQTTLVTGGYRCIKIWQRRDVDAFPPASSSPDEVLEGLGDIGEVVASVATNDNSRLAVLVRQNGAIRVKLFELPSKNLIRELGPEILWQDRLAASQRRVGLRKEQLRVAEADVEVAKKRKEEDEANAKKTAEEVKKSEEEVPKREETLAQAEATLEEKRSEIAVIEALLKQQTKRLEEIKNELSAASEDNQADLAQEQTSVQAEIETKTEELKSKQAELETAEKDEKKRRQEFEGVKKALELAKEASARAVKAIERRSEELSAAEEVVAAAQQQVQSAADAAKVEQQTAASSMAKLTGLRLLDEGWRFEVWDDQRRVAQFTADQGQILSIETAPTDSEWQLVKTIGYPDSDAVFAHRVTALAFSADGRVLATGGGEPSRTGEVAFWSTADWSLIAEMSDVHSDVVYDLQFSLLDEILASCASDRMMKVIDLTSTEVIRAFEGHTGHVMGVSWRADGRTLATAGADKVVKVWDLKEGTQKKTVSGFKTEVTAIRFLGLEDRFVFSTGDGQVQSRDSAGENKPAFAGYSDYVHRVSCSRDGAVVAASGQDQVIRVWNADGTLQTEFR